MASISTNSRNSTAFEAQLPSSEETDITKFTEFFIHALESRRLLYCDKIGLDGDAQHEPTTYEKGFILITGVVTNPERSWAFDRWESGEIDDQQISLASDRSIPCIVNIIDFPRNKYDYQIITKQRDEELFSLLLYSLETNWSQFDNAVLKPRIDPFALPDDFFS